MRIYLKNIPAKFTSSPILNSEPDGHPNNKKKNTDNKMSSNMGSWSKILV